MKGLNGWATFLYAVSVIGCKCGRVAGWQGGKVAGWQGGRVAGWQGGRWQGGKVAGGQGGKVARWQVAVKITFYALRFRTSYDKHTHTIRLGDSSAIFVSRLQINGNAVANEAAVADEADAFGVVGSCFRP